MPNLVQIHLDNNSFVGSIPSFSSISDLGDLDLSYNQLTGTIPSNFIGGQNDNALISIDVSHNFLAGTVPSLFGRFKHLEIDLKANHFDGKKPLLSTLLFCWLCINNKFLMISF